MASPHLVIGKESVRSDAMSAKLRQDIAFLTDRLSRLEKQLNPNPEVLKVYREMLESRHAVLNWLDENKRSA